MEEKVVKIKQVSEREIWVGENRLYLGEDNVLYITNTGEIDEKIAIGIKGAVLKLMNMIEGKVHTLTDLNKAGKSTSPARKVFQELAEHEKQGKNAFYGVHPVARVLASFFTIPQFDETFYKLITQGKPNSATSCALPE
ncbi:hypothetical protein ES705_26556 [subsurface metagenome]